MMHRGGWTVPLGLAFLGAAVSLAAGIDVLAPPLCTNATLLTSGCIQPNSSSPIAANPSNETTTSSSVLGTTVRPTALETSPDQRWTSTTKFYLGASIWLGCMVLGLAFAVKMRQLPASAIEPPTLQQSMSAHQSTNDKDQSTDPHPPTTLSPNPYYFLTKHSNVRSSTSSQSVAPMSMRSLASIASTTTNHTNHHNNYLSSSLTSLGDFRPSRPADTHVPRFVYRESDDVSTSSSSATLVTTSGMRWHTELQDLSEDTCFESMRTRFSNLTMLDMDADDIRQDTESRRDTAAVVV